MRFSLKSTSSDPAVGSRVIFAFFATVRNFRHLLQLSPPFASFATFTEADPILPLFLLKQNPSDAVADAKETAFWCIERPLRNCLLACVRENCTAYITRTRRSAEDVMEADGILHLPLFMAALL